MIYRNGKCYHCGRFGHYAKECHRTNKNSKSYINKKNNKIKPKHHSNPILKFNKHKSYNKNINKQINFVKNQDNHTAHSDDFSKNYNSEDGIFVGCVTNMPRAQYDP